MKQITDPENDAATDRRLLLLSPNDNVVVLRAVIERGEQIYVRGISVMVKEHISLGHKLAAAAIPLGAKVIKYGAPIGSATRDIALGEHVHINNIKSDYTPTHSLENEKPAPASKRKDK